jgi:uncharacterized protein
MIFEIHAEKNANDKKIFYYDNMKNELKDQTGYIFHFTDGQKFVPSESTKETKPFDKNNPLKKSKTISHLKIQMGLSCNYSCDYCSQKFVERAPETSKKDIDAFLAKLDNLEFSEQKGLRIEFWGGEPFVYWKTFKPLAEALRERFSHWKKQPQFSVITNGSILTREICAWLVYMNFSVAISHDGPGQSVRGPDPFEDEEQKKIVLEFYKRAKGKSGLSFNAMMNSKNKSRKAVHDWFINFTGDPEVVLGEGGIVDAYDEDGITNSLQTKEEHFGYRRTSFKDIYENKGYIGFYMTMNKIDTFTKSVLGQRDAKYVNQKCGMDDEHTLAIDLRGNVLTCQNVSAIETSKNGESHLGGTLDDYENVSIKSSTHWMNRKECSGCPVLHLCQGACMFLDQKFWDISCANAYSDNVALFALSIERITGGYIPTLIKNDFLPLERQDIWGTVYEHKEEPKKKIIPIKVVSEKIGEIEGIEVYGKSRVEVNP